MRYRKRALNVNRILKNKQNTRKQYKVHNEQMSKYDVQNLTNVVAHMDFNALRMSWHVINKRDTKFTVDLFRDVLINNIGKLDTMLIEYSEIPITTHYGKVIDKRVLIRDRKDYDGFHLCFVLSLIKNEIVTAYWIEKDFTHEGLLNWNRYSSTYYISV